MNRALSDEKDRLLSPIGADQGLVRLANGEVPVEGITPPEVIAMSDARYSFAAQLLKGKRVLDVGCACGRGSAQLAQAGAAEVVGIDRCTEAIHRGRRVGSWPNLDLLAVELQNYEPDGKFDVVVAFEVIEHCHNPELVLTKIREWLTPEGVSFISTPNGERLRSTPYRNPYHEFEWTMHQFRQHLSSFFSRHQLYGQGRIGPALARQLQCWGCGIWRPQAWRRLAARSLRELARIAGFRESRSPEIYRIQGPDLPDGQGIPMVLIAVCGVTAMEARR